MLDGVSIHPVTTKIQASFLTQLPERKETAQGIRHEDNGDFKTVAEFNGCDRRKLRMNQQRCSLKIIMGKCCTIPVWKDPRNTHSSNCCQRCFYKVLTQGCEYFNNFAKKSTNMFSGNTTKCGIGPGV